MREGVSWDKWLFGSTAQAHARDWGGGTRALCTQGTYVCAAESHDAHENVSSFLVAVAARKRVSGRREGGGAGVVPARQEAARDTGVA